MIRKGYPGSQLLLGRQRQLAQRKLAQSFHPTRESNPGPLPCEERHANHYTTAEQRWPLLSTYVKRITNLRAADACQTHTSIESGGDAAYGTAEDA